MVGGEAEGHHGADDHLAVADDNSVLHSRYTENGNLRLIDDRSEAFNAVHAQICDGKGSSAKLLHGQATLSGQFCQGLDLCGDLSEALLVGVTNIRNNKAVIQSNRNSHIHIVLIYDPVILN